MKTRFDLGRFGYLMKYMLMSEYKYQLRGILGLAFGMSMCFGMNIYTNKNNFIDYDSFGFDWFYSNLAAMAVMCGFFLMLVLDSNIFKNMLTKQGRISFLSLPASNLEKFLARFLWVNISGWVIFVVGIAIADGVQALVSLSLGLGVHGSVIAAFFPSNPGAGSNLPLIGVHETEFLCFLLSAALLFNASWTFFGTLFRKNAWLWSLSLNVLFITLIAMVVDSNIDIICDLDKQMGHDVMLAIVDGVMISVSALLYFGSYKLFKRMQVINNRWVNL